MSIFRDFSGQARTHGAPVTVGLVVLLVLGFVVQWVAPSSGFLTEAVFLTSSALEKPWTFLTYPFAVGANDFLSLVFSCLWLWGIGGQVERDVGSRRYVAVWLVFSALFALGLWGGALLLNTPAGLWGAWNPIAALTVIWGTRNAGAQIQIMFVLPITGKWLAWLSAGLVFFGTRPPQLAPFGVVALVVAYLFAAQKLPFAPYFAGHRGRIRGENPAGTRKVYPKEYYDDVKRREQSRREKEKLRELFERSMIDDPDERK